MIIPINIHATFMSRSRDTAKNPAYAYADSSTNTTVGWTKNNQKPDFFKKGKYHQKRKHSKMSRNMPKLAMRPSTRDH